MISSNSVDDCSIFINRQKTCHTKVLNKISIFQQIYSLNCETNSLELTSLWLNFGHSVHVQKFRTKDFANVEVQIFNQVLLLVIQEFKGACNLVHN